MVCLRERVRNFATELALYYWDSAVQEASDGGTFIIIIIIIIIILKVINELFREKYE